MPIEPQDQPVALEAARRALYRPGAGSEELAAFERLRREPARSSPVPPPALARHRRPPIIAGVGLAALLVAGGFVTALARSAPAAPPRTTAPAAVALHPTASPAARTGALPPEWRGAKVVATAGPSRGSQYLPTGVEANAFLLLVDCPAEDGTWRAAWDGLVTLSAPCSGPTAVPLAPTGGTLRVGVDGRAPFRVALLAR